MKEDIKEKWIKALRSGDYEQGRNFLRTAADGYCCLGVLCDQLNGQWELDNAKNCYAFFSSHGDDPEELYLPYNLQEAIGVPIDDEMSLAGMNDDSVPFNEIADWIEENL